MRYTQEDFSHKTILITGGAGFIGSNLAFYFQMYHPKAHVVVFDCFRSTGTFENGNLKSLGHAKNLLGFKGTVITGDITSTSDCTCLNDYNFDYIFHQAAISDTTVKDQKIMIETNVHAFENLLNVCLKNQTTMIYASSASTYGDLKSPQTVGLEHPQNIYGLSKLQMDTVATTFSKEHPTIRVIGLRYFNVYGSKEYLKGASASMVVQLGHQILAGNAPKLFVNSDKIMRDFIYIEDVIQANIKAMHSPRSGIYNVGTSVPRSFQDIADILQAELQTTYGTTYIPNPYLNQYQFHTQANIKSTQLELNFEPNYTLEEGIKAYLPEIKALYDEYYA